MSNTVYRWKGNSRIPIDANVAGRELEQIAAEKKGKLCAEAVVKKATPKKSPLHEAFEWDNTEAAKQYRLDQARYLIRSIVVVMEKPDQEEPTTVRAFVRISDAPKTPYESIVTVMSDKEKRESLMELALRELGQWRARYDGFKEFAKIYAAIDQVVKPGKGMNHAKAKESDSG